MHKFNYLVFAALDRIRLILLRLSNKRIAIARGVRIGWRTRIYSKGDTHVELQPGVVLWSRGKGYHAGMAFPTTLLLDQDEAEIKIGANTRINGAYIHAKKKIQIGENCVIAANVNILDSNGHELYSMNRTKGRDEPSPVSIGNNVWIGLNAVILKGTVVGDNSVIGAGSVVRGIFPNNSLIVGNPAAVVKTIDVSKFGR